MPNLAKNTTDFSKPMPSAASLAEQHGLPPANAWLLCEPVECIEAQKEVICLGNAHHAITLEEAQAHVARINQYWEGTGRQLFAINPTQWLLALSEPVSFVSSPLHAVLNQPVPKQMPRLFFEGQLFMQGHALNAWWISG